MGNRVTMASLAKDLGLSPSTVSRALRGDPRISRKTKERVAQAAKSQGYQPNPMVSTLMTMRRKAGGTGEVDTVALVTDYRGGGSWKTKDVCRWEYEGICQRAAELGFRIEEFSLSDYQYDGEKLVRALLTRGIRGVLLGFSRARSSRIKLDLDGFCVAGLSTYFGEYAVDRANFNGLYNVRLAFSKMRALGFRRTGLVSPELNNRVSGYLWSSGVLDWQRGLNEDERCLPFLPKTEDSEKDFGLWLEKEKPDSLVVYKLPVRSWLSKRGLRVPEDLAVAHLFRTRDEMTTGIGIDGNLPLVGAAAFDLVVEGLNTNRTGLPTFPKEVLVRGCWRAKS